MKQHDITDCGAACLATVSKQYGYTTSITRIREIAGTDKMGTNAYGLVKAAGQLGFTAKGVKGNVEAFFSDFPLPAIANVVVDGTLLHYVVIHKISKKKIIIADPGKGIVKKTPDEFFKEWTGVLILLSPSQDFKKGNENRNIFERFFRLIIPQKKLVFEIVFASIVITLLGILGAFYFQVIIDDILPAGIVKTLTVLSIGVMLLKLFSVILEYMRAQLMIYLSQKLDISLLLGYYNHVLKLPMNFFGTRKVGEIVSRFQDASSIREAISQATLTVLIDIVMAIAGGIILFFKNKVLFAVSFAMVILYGLLVIAFNKPYETANQKQIHEFINEMPLRYETHLDENGSNLSGGQRQRLAIARAMLKNPEILILDEATSNLDAVTEKAIQETLETYSSGMTTIIIAHRLSTIRRCDRIFVMDKGKLLEEGTHNELMQKQDSYYRNLYQSQLGELS